MTLANLGSEMGAKNAVFPNDEVLSEWLGEEYEGIWADEDAEYVREIEVDLSKIFPLVAAPHHVDNVKAVSEVKGTKLQQAMVGTCTNGRYEDLEIVAEILKGKQMPAGFQMIIVPASQKVYMKALRNGLIEILMEAGANVLSASCGPCLGTGQGIPADGYNVISTSNRNFKGRMGNKESFIYLASPATVAYSALAGEIVDPRGIDAHDKFPYAIKETSTVVIPEGENRRLNGVWNYTDVNDLNTDQMFAGNLTYKVLSSEPDKIMPHLFEGFDTGFKDTFNLAISSLSGANFGCGSSREHPAVGLAYAGVEAVICKSVNRIFYRSSVNQGLPIIILPEAVDAYKPGDEININYETGTVTVEKKTFTFAALPEKLVKIFEAKGLVNFIKENA